MNFDKPFLKKLKRDCGIAFRKLKITPSINKCLIKEEKIIKVDCCSTARKLIFEIMHQHHAHPYFGVLTILAGMKRILPSITHQ
jgi:hypothetical protein